MKAVLCKNFGPPETLVVEEIASPVPDAGQVVVDVEAVALNFFDTLIIEDKYQFKPSLPFSPGAEFAGRISKVGGGVSGFAEGDRVMGYLPWGAAREQIAVDTTHLISVPDGLDSTVAAAVIVTYGTSYYALKDRGRLKPGETALVLGAAGGVGQAALELAKLMGAKVIAAASSDEKLAFCKELGADETINYAKEDLKDRAKELTGGRGVDVTYDPVGGDFAEAAVRASAWNGRFLVIGFASGKIPKIPLNLALLKSCDLVGVFWGAFTERTPELHRANTEQILNWCLEGKLKPHIHGTYRLEETARALDDLANRRVKGKAVLVP